MKNIETVSRCFSTVYSVGGVFVTAFLFFFCFVHLTEEAAIRTCMASNTSLFFIDQQSIIVAITVHTDDFLQMSGSCTFIPKFLPRTTPEPSVSGFQCLFQAFPIHICQHQHGFGVDFIDNCWNQVAFFKIGIQMITINFNHALYPFSFLFHQIVSELPVPSEKSCKSKPPFAKQYFQAKPSFAFSWT